MTMARTLQHLIAISEDFRVEKRTGAHWLIDWFTIANRLIWHKANKYAINQEEVYIFHLTELQIYRIMDPGVQMPSPHLAH